MMANCDALGHTIDHRMFNPPAVYAPHYQRPPNFDEHVLWAMYATSDFHSLNRSTVPERFATSSSFIDTQAFKLQLNRQTKAIAEFSVYWKKFLSDPNADVDVDAISESIDFVYEAIDQFGPGGVDLNNLEASHVSGEHLAAILRATSSWKTLVPGWTEALAVAVDALKLAKIDVDDALIGLI